MKALECAPYFLPSAKNLFENAMQVGDYQTARAVLDHLKANFGPSEEWATFGAAYFEKIVGPQQAENFLRDAVAQNPYSLAPRIVLARRLLNAGRDRKAQEHLEVLEGFGSAEAIFYLGISATRRGDLRAAFSWMQRAHELNPGHQDTVKQLNNLEAALKTLT